jgi:hypothetical protein
VNDVGNSIVVIPPGSNEPDLKGAVSASQVKWEEVFVKVPNEEAFLWRGADTKTRLD